MKDEKTSTIIDVGAAVAELERREREGPRLEPKLEAIAQRIWDSMPGCADRECHACRSNLRKAREIAFAAVTETARACAEECDKLANTYYFSNPAECASAIRARFGVKP